MTTTNLENLKVTELKEMAKELKVSNWWTLKKVDLIKAIQWTEGITNPPTLIEEVDPELHIKEALTKALPAYPLTEINSLISYHKMDGIEPLLNFLSNSFYYELQYINKSLAEIAEGNKPNDTIGTLEEIKTQYETKKVAYDKRYKAITKVQNKYFPQETPERVTQPENEDIITLKELIIEAGIKGTKARRILRNEDIERPFKRWEWSSTKHALIIEQVKSLLN